MSSTDRSTTKNTEDEETTLHNDVYCTNHSTKKVIIINNCLPLIPPHSPSLRVSTWSPNNLQGVTAAVSICVPVARSTWHRRDSQSRTFPLVRVRKSKWNRRCRSYYVSFKSVFRSTKTRWGSCGSIVNTRLRSLIKTRSTSRRASYCWRRN